MRSTSNSRTGRSRKVQTRSNTSDSPPSASAQRRSPKAAGARGRGDTSAREVQTHRGRINHRKASQLGLHGDAALRAATQKERGSFEHRGGAHSTVRMDKHGNRIGWDAEGEGYTAEDRERAGKLDDRSYYQRGRHGSALGVQAVAQGIVWQLHRPPVGSCAPVRCSLRARRSTASHPPAPPPRRSLAQPQIRSRCAMTRACSISSWRSNSRHATRTPPARHPRATQFECTHASTPHDVSQHALPSLLFYSPQSGPALVASNGDKML